jgi:N-methylhydantoinase B/oxoprolinase/acetone carboxylase alpha subunit
MSNKWTDMQPTRTRAWLSLFGCRANGDITELESCDRAEMQVGDVFEILTPGGGGYGAS